MKQSQFKAGMVQNESGVRFIANREVGEVPNVVIHSRNSNINRNYNRTGDSDCVGCLKWCSGCCSVKSCCCYVIIGVGTVYTLYILGYWVWNGFAPLGYTELVENPVKAIGNIFP